MSLLAMSHAVEDRRQKTTLSAVERMAELYEQHGNEEDAKKAIQHAEYLKLKIQENDSDV